MRSNLHSRTTEEYKIWLTFKNEDININPSSNKTPPSNGLHLFLLSADPIPKRLYLRTKDNYQSHLLL